LEMARKGFAKSYYFMSPFPVFSIEVCSEERNLLCCPNHQISVAQDAQKVSVTEKIWKKRTRDQASTTKRRSRRLISPKLDSFQTGSGQPRSTRKCRNSPCQAKCRNTQQQVVKRMVSVTTCVHQNEILYNMCSTLAKIMSVLTPSGSQ